MKIRRYILNRYFFLALILAVLAWFGWSRYLAPTHIALVHFQDFQVAEMIRSKDNAFVRVDRFDTEELESKSLSRYDLLIFFGRGLNLTPEQSAAVGRAQASGTRVFVEGATNPNSDPTDLEGEIRNSVRGYMENGGPQNFQTLFNFVRRDIDGKSLFSGRVHEPVVIPREALFHLGAESFFATYEEFDAYYRAQGLEKEGAPRVALLTSIVGPRSADRSHVDALIERLEAAAINVIPIAGFSKRLEFLQAAEPNLVIYLPHGRLVPGRADAVLDWLKERGTPVLAPLELLESRTEWLEDQQGLGGGMLTQSIVMPELDGAIEPFVISAQTPNEMGLNTFAVMPERLDTLVSRVEHWLSLQRKENKDKKVAIVYLKGPGMNAMVAGGMEVAPSLFHVLQSLRDAGYDTGELPADAQAFEDIIQQKGPVLGPYARGAFEQFLLDGDPEVIPAETYLSWCAENLPPAMYESVVAKYGEAPGQYLSLNRDGQPCLAIPRVQFGNVVLLPQLLPGLGEDTGKLVHGTKEAPPHPYLATYLWAREGFGADVLMHFGTHGSLEFTPYRQTALSPNDWADAMVGDLPHLYVYVINNISEAMIAKRRSYATILSYLTPPFAESELYGVLSEIQEAASTYQGTDDLALRTALSERILAGVEEAGLQVDLKLPWPLERSLTDEEIDQIHNYLYTIGQEKITQGLYALGKPYTAPQREDTVRMMQVDPISEARFSLDVMNGQAEEALRERPAAWDEQYRTPARETINQLLAGSVTAGDILPASDVERMRAWEEENATLSGDALFAGFLAMADAQHGRGGHGGGSTGGPALDALVVAAAASSEQREFLLSLEDDQTFERVSGVLKPGGLENARRIAKVVPPMRKALDVLERPQVMDVVQRLQEPGTRETMLSLLKDPARQAEILEAQAEAERQQVARLLSADYKVLLFQAADTGGFGELARGMNRVEAERAQAVLLYYEKNAELADHIAAEGGQDGEAVAAMLRSSDATLKPALQALAGRIAELDEADADYAGAVRRLHDALHDVPANFEALATSPAMELESILASLDGKYIPPSSGGDPIVNPQSLPTGRNMYSIDAERTPSPEAWKLGQQMAEDLIQKKTEDGGAPPQKVALTLWGGDFITTQGLELAVAFSLLGVEPVRNPRGVVHDVQLIPREELGRPRVDVVVQTSGQFRDMAASRIYLLNKAVELAAGADDGGEGNAVAEGTRLAEQRMKEEGLSPADARAFATARVFGGVNGNYGTNIMGLVEASDRWEDSAEVGAQYLENMGAIYTESHWGHYQPGIFSGALQNTDTLLHPRGSNVDGALSLDHVYEFMGGLNAAINAATGTDPAGYFNDMRNTVNPEIVGAEEAIWTEARTTLLNPKYITALQDGGSSSAEVFAETFRNTFGWTALKPAAIDSTLWDRLEEVYVEDIHDLEMRDYFEEKNPYAYQELTAVMLETVRKGYWNPDEATVERIAQLHAELVRDHDPGCSGFVCDNGKLRDFIGERLDSALEETYDDAIEQVRTGSVTEEVEGMRLEKQTDTLEELAATIRENSAPLLAVGLILFIAIALVVVGVRRRHRAS